MRPKLLAVLLCAALAATVAPSGFAQSKFQELERRLKGSAQPVLRLNVLSTRPHDPQAFTQGLLLHDGKLYESTGQYGQSTLRRVDPSTGKVEKSVALPADHFGEGLALVGKRLIQLTWKNERALVWDLDTFKLLKTLPYRGEGWGLAYDGRRLIMSNGSDKLFFRDPDTFALQGEVSVKFRGTPVPNLNELEYVGGVVLANVWMTQQIVMINPGSGEVFAVLQADGLLPPGLAQQVDVLNGIAWNPANNSLLITGKLWPKLFEVQIKP